MNKEWEEVNLPKLFREYKAGGTPKTSNEDYYGGNIPFLKIDSITGNKYINEGSTKITDRGLKDSTSRTYQEGDIILTIYGSYGKVGILKKDMAISQAMVGIKVNTGVSNTEFLYYLLDSLQPEYDSLATGTTQQNLSKGLLGLIDVELPPLWEQERIASVLYSVDELLEGLRGKRDNLQETKQGLMQNLLTGEKRVTNQTGTEDSVIHKVETRKLKKLDKGTPTSLELSYYEGIPEEWDWKKIGDIANIKSGSSRDQVEKKTNIKVSRIETISDGEIDMGSVGYVKADKEDISDYKYESGDLIFSNINSEEHIGKTAIFDIEEDLYHGMNTLRIRTNLVNRYYLYYVFSSDIQKKVWRRISQPAVNQVSINQSILKNVNIPVPPLWEQERIASVFYTVDEMISNVEDKIECLEELKQGLMQDLLTGNKRTPQNLQKLEQITQH